MSHRLDQAWWYGTEYEREIAVVVGPGVGDKGREPLVILSDRSVGDSVKAWPMSGGQH